MGTATVADHHKAAVLLNDWAVLHGAYSSLERESARLRAREDSLSHRERHDRLGEVASWQELVALALRPERSRSSSELLNRLTIEWGKRWAKRAEAALYDVVRSLEATTSTDKALRHRGVPDDKALESLANTLSSWWLLDDPPPQRSA